MTLGERIREQRTRAGLSQEKVAELVGVSRQAVTKWEGDQSAPSTENLFKLADLFGTTVDMLMVTAEKEQSDLAEQIYHLHKTDQEKQAAQRRARRRGDLLCALGVAGGYVLLYFGGRIFGTAQEPITVMEWLTGTRHLPYLLGWLLDRKLFWMAMGISVLPALFGKRYFSCTALGGCVLGMVLGELCGVNPPGAPYGHGHYGWAIWGCSFLLSLGMGALLEGKKSSWKSKQMKLWTASFGAGIFLIVLAIRAGMPTSFS